MTDNLDSLSYSDLRESAAAIEREVARREAQDEADRAEAFEREVAEVRAGARRADPEHVRALTPAETVEVINRGQVPGIGPDRRLARRR